MQLFQREHLMKFSPNIASKDFIYAYKLNDTKHMLETQANSCGKTVSDPCYRSAQGLSLRWSR